MSRLRATQLCDLHEDYLHGKFGDCRFGQHVLNEYFPDMIDPRLYYEPESYRALSSMLYDSYICSDSDYF